MVLQGPVVDGFTAVERVITRAADCNCMPGFIPSKQAGVTEGTSYFCQRLGDPQGIAKCY
jgi:hypothetical protein